MIVFNAQRQIKALFGQMYTTLQCKIFCEINEFRLLYNPIKE